MQPPAIDGYVCSQLLGIGGMGAVFLAHRVSDGLAVAIKVIRYDEDDLSGVRVRTRRELGVSRTFAHPFLPKIIDGGTLPGGHDTFLVMEYLDGRDLARTATERRATEGEARRILAHMAEALSYIHARGLLHRDVKPGNIFLATGERTVLLDFGLAQAPDVTRITRTGVILGTLAFMAPEQLLGQPLTPATDLYGLAASVYAALTGVPAYETKDFLRIETLDDDALPSPEPALRARVSGELTDLVMGCLRLDPDHRPATADALAAAVAALPPLLPPPRPSSPSTTAPHPPVPSPKPSAGLGTHRSLAAPVLILLMVLVLALGLALRDRGPLPSPPSSPAASIIQEVTSATWPPSPDSCERLGLALRASGMTSRHALPADLPPGTTALAWLGLRARDEGRWDDALRAYMLAVERDGPFCLSAAGRDAPGLILEGARHVRSGPAVADALDAMAAAASDPAARDRLRFTAEQVRIGVLDSTEPAAAVCAPQVRIMEEWFERPPRTVTPLEVTLALVRALSCVRTSEARDRVLAVLRTFVSSTPDLKPRDSLTLHYEAFQAVTRDYPDDLMQPDRTEHVKAAQDLADTILGLAARLADASTTTMVIHVAAGLYGVGHRREGWKVLDSLDPARLSLDDRCDLHRTRASFHTAERAYEAAVDEQRAARRLARTEAMRTSIDKNIQRIRTLQVVWPAGQGTEGP